MRRRSATVCGVVLAGLAGSAAGQVDRTWAEAVSGDFGNGGNWTPAGTPQPEDSVFIGAVGDPYAVTLDDTYTVMDFSLTWGGATLSLLSQSIGTNRDFTLVNGTVAGQNDGGAVLVGRDAALTGGVMRDFALFAAVRNVTATNMTFENIGQFDIGPGGRLAIAGDSTFTGVEMVNAADGLDIDTSGGALARFDDTCVNNGRVSNWTGAGAVDLSNGSEFMNPNGSTFQSQGTGDQTMTGDGTGSFDNGGMFKKTGGEGDRHHRGGEGFRTEISGVTFNNTGTVEVDFGELDFNTQIVNDSNALDSGEWRVLGNATLTLQDQSVEGIVGGSKVLISGAKTSFEAIDALRLIGEASEFAIDQGQNFGTPQSFTNNGRLVVGDGSAFFADESGFTNYSDGALIGGEYEIRGLLATPVGHQVSILEAKVTLVGPDSVFAGLNPLHTVGSAGEFGVTGGRGFETVGSLTVQEGGKVLVGAGSLLAVTGPLTNFDDGIFDDGLFEVAGTLLAPDLAVQVISNELILDGVGSQFQDDMGHDALASLTYIAPDGILRLRNGRSLENLDSLIVDGVLEIDPGPGGMRGPVAHLSTEGDLTLSETSTLIIGIHGIGAGMFGSLESGGDVTLGAEALAGGALTLLVGPGYEAKLGDELVFIRGAGVAGEFAMVEGTDLGGGLYFGVIYGPDTVSLRVFPTPGTAAAFTALGLMAARRRRR